MTDKLKDYGVSTVIAIDDNFNKIQKSDVLGRFDPEIIDELTDGEYDFFKDSTIDDYMSEKEDYEFIDRLSFRLKNSDRYGWLESDDVCLQKIEANEESVRDAIEAIDSTDKSKKHLIILDRELCPNKDANKDALFRNILKLIGTFLEEKNLLLLIYTESPTPNELNSFEGAKNYLIKLGLEERVADKIRLHFNYVQKTSELSNDFFDNILKSQKANYIQEYTNIFEESYAKLTERLWELNRNPVLFYYDYINEGQHPDNIIYETFMAKFKKVYSAKFSNSDKHAELINPIRRSMQQSVQPIMEKSDVYRFLKELDLGLTLKDRITELPASTDISFGDIVEIGNQKYVIISQDCDIAIRNDSNRKLSSFQLVEIESKEKPVTEKWLSSELKKRKINIGDSIIKRTLRKYHISDDTIDRVTNSQTPKASLSDEQINDLTFYSSFEVKDKAIIHSVNCVWLDALLLKEETDGTLVLSKENIRNSHEIRYVTQQYLKQKLDGLLDRMNDESDKKIVDRIINFSFNNLEIQCDSLLSSDNKIEGFRISNMRRVGRLSRLDAMKILKNVVDHESRIPTIDNLLI